MYMLLNVSNVIIDIVDNVRYVKKNSNGISQLCYPYEAEGIIASDNNSVYLMSGKQITPSFYDVYSSIQVDSIDSGVTALKYKYVDGKFVANTDSYPDTNLNLTKTTKETSESVNNTQDAFVDLYTQLAALDARIKALEGK